MPTLEWNQRFGKEVALFAEKGEPGRFYGDRWGSIEERDDLIAVRQKFLEPFVSPQAVVLEIGSGGGRWTQYLLACKRLTCVELNPEMLNYLRNRFASQGHVSYVMTSGHDLPFIPDDSIDFVFSFGTFVHLETDVVGPYVESMSRAMKAGANVVLQISNRHKTRALMEKRAFSDNSPEVMAELFSRNRIQMLNIDNDVLVHSTMVRGQKIMG